MAKRKMQRIAALMMSAAIAFTSAPSIVYANNAGSGALVSNASTADSENIDTGNAGTESGRTELAVSDSSGGNTVNSSSETILPEITGLTIHMASGLVYNGKAQKLVTGIDGTEAGDLIEYKIDNGDTLTSANNTDNDSNSTGNDGQANKNAITDNAEQISSNETTSVNDFNSNTGSGEDNLTDDGYSADTPEATDAGNYKVVIRIQRSGYQTLIEKMEVAIAKADMKVTVIPCVWNYDGSEKELLAKPSVTDGPSDVVFRYAVNDGTLSTDIPKAADAGSYRIHITANGDANYNDYDAYVDASINAVSISGLSATLYGGTYDGDRHNAVTSIKLSNGTDILDPKSGYTVYYKMDGIDYGTTMPTVKNAGIYTVEISVDKDANHMKTDIAHENLTPAAIVIGKAKPELSWNPSMPDGSRVTTTGNTTLDLHAVCTNASATDRYSNIAYTVANDSVNDTASAESLASIDANGVLTLKKAGCNLLVTASCKGDANHEDADQIAFGLTVVEDDQDVLLHFTDLSQTFRVGTSNTAAEQAAVKADDDNGTITYSLTDGNISAEDAGISIDKTTGRVSVDDEKKLIRAVENENGTVSFTINAQKTAGTKTAEWAGWTDSGRTVFDEANAFYTLVFRLDSSLSLSDVTLEDTSGSSLKSANGDNGWYNSAIIAKPTSGWLISKDNLSFSDSVTFGASGNDQGSALTFGVYLKNVKTGAVSRRIALTNLAKLDTVSPVVTSISLSSPKTKKGLLWFFNRSNNKAVVTVTGTDDTSGIDRFEWIYEKSADASDSNENMLTGTAAASRQPDGTYQASFTLPDDAAEELENGQLRGVLSVTAIDKAGLKQGKTDDGRTIIVDSISPIIQTQITTESENTPINKKDNIYYTAGEKVFVSLDVTEANFDADDVRINVKKNDAAVNTAGAWESGSEDDMHRYILPLFGEGDYLVTVSYQDASGNKMDDASYEIRIDQTAPGIAVQYINEDIKNKIEENGKTRNYYAADQIARVTVAEHNFDASKVHFDIKTDGNAADSSMYHIGSWTTNGDKHIADIVFSEDANYSFNVSCTDLAGNASVDREDDIFTVDKTAPTGKLQIDDDQNIFEKLLSQIHYWIYGTHTINVTGSEEDATSGIASTEYIIFHPSPDESAKGTFSGLSETDLDKESGWKTFAGSVSINPDSAGFVYLRMTDIAGNRAYINISTGIIADSAEPRVDIALDDKPARGGIYNSDVPFTVTTTDPVKGDTYSGLKDIRWSVITDGKKTQSGTFDDGLSRDARVREQVGHAVIDATKNNSNNVLVHVEAEDWAGNVTTKELELSIDATSPKIVISYDNNNAQNKKYFKNDRSMTVTITERNYNEDDFSFPMTIDGVKRTVSFADIRDGKYSLTMIRDKVDTEENMTGKSLSDSRTITYVIGFGKETDADHDYTVAMEGQDISGNATDVSFADGSVAPSEFTIDKVAPVVRVEVQTSGKALAMTTDASNPAFTQNDVLVTETIEERNFDPKDASYQVTQKNAKGKDLTVYSAADITEKGRWTSNGAVNTFRANVFSEDANYSIAFAYTDLAGNKAVPYDTHYFTVDKTAPTGLLQVEDDDTIFDKLVDTIHYWIFGNHSIGVTGSSDDETSGVAQTEYLIYHPTPDEYAKGMFRGLSETALNHETGWRAFNGSVSINPNSSGFVYLKITDRAGNVAYINTADGAVADQTAPDDITITLDNAPARGDIYSGDVPFTVKITDPENGDTYSGLKNIRWSVLTDGVETQSGTFNDGLERDERVQTQTGHAIVEASKNNSNNVVIRVEAEDWAGNTATKEQEFSIDTTKPEVTLSYDNNSAQNGKYFKNDRNMTVTIRERNYEESDFFFPMTIDGETRTVSISDIRNGSYSLTMVRDKSDSQSERDVRAMTDDRIITYVIGFGKTADADHDYTVAMEGQDTAGNAAVVSFAGSPVAPSEFTIDKVAPVIQVTTESGGREIDPTADAANPAFTQSPAEVTARITERNFDAKDASYQVTQKNATGNTLSVYTPSDITSNSRWSRSGNISTFNANVFSEDANYSIAFSYSDLAGNTAVPYTVHYFTVDKTAPTGSLTTGTNGVLETFTNLIERLRFWFTNRIPISVTGSCSDETAGLASVRYLVYDPGANARNTFAGLTASQLEAMSGWADWNGSISLSPNRQAIAYLRMEDRAGNVAYVNTADGVIADDNKPSNIQIEFLGTPSSQNIYNGDVPFRITATDPESGGTYSGLRHVAWEVRSSGRITQSGNFDSQAGDVSARTQTITGAGTISASQNNSNHVVLHVTTEDWAGNTAEAEKELSIDITKPVIEITYDRNDPANGRYYNDVRTATVRVMERNFDPSKISLNITPTGTAPQISGWSISSERGESDSAVNTATITFSADADYTVTASCTDMAGNRSDYSRTDSFTIDRTAPEISVSYDNNNVSNGHYYRNGRTATITVKEHNFNASAFAAAIKAAYAGSEKTAPTVSAFTKNGDINTATVHFADDGDYSFTLRDTDLAGNNAPIYTQPEFTIDTKAPELSFFDIKDHSANKDTVAPGVRSTDLNFDDSAITMTLKGVNHKEKIAHGMVSATANGVSIKLKDFAHNKATDDIYTLTARIVDKAGNVTEKSITFSVNRYGSNYTFGKETEKLLNQYYLKQGSSIVVRETNVDAIVSTQIVILKDGTSTILTKDRDYTIKDESEKNGWHKYEYTINGNCFTEEGLYEIQIRSTDKAGNIQDNKIKESPIRFVIDHTAPTAVITGIENNGRYKEISRTMHIQVTDNYACGSVSLYVGDKKVKTFDADTVAKADGKLSYKLESANGWQNIRVEYTDLSGNSGDPVSMRVLVTASTWQQILYSAWFLPTCIGVLCGISIIIILILLLKRKRRMNLNKNNS